MSVFLSGFHLHQAEKYSESLGVREVPIVSGEALPCETGADAFVGGAVEAGAVVLGGAGWQAGPGEVRLAGLASAGGCGADGRAPIGGCGADDGTVVGVRIVNRSGGAGVSAGFVPAGPAIDPCARSFPSISS